MTAGAHLAAGSRWVLDIAHQIGHSSTRVTEAVYIQLAQDHMRATAGLMGVAISKAMAENPTDQMPIAAEVRKDGKIAEHLTTRVIPTVPATAK